MASEYTVQQKKDELWRRGVLAPWKLHPTQQKMYTAFHTSPARRYVINSSRRLGKCLAEGTEVMTPNGPTQIQNLRPGDSVYGYNRDGSVSITKVVAVEYQGEKKVTELLSMGKVIARCTDEHRWLTTAVNCKGEKERAAGDFYKGVQIRREFVSIPCGGVSEPHAYAIGALLGDGCSRQMGNRIQLSSQDDLIPNKVGNILGAAHVYKAHSSNYTWYLSSQPKRNGKGGKGGQRSEKIVCNYYDGWIRNKYAHEKTIDWSVVNTWDRESCLQLLAGLIDTDGSVSGSKNRLNIQFCGQAFDVVEVFQKLLWKLFQIKYQIGVERRSKYVNGPLFYISVSNSATARRILKELGDRIVTQRKQYKPEYEDLPTTNYKENSVGVKKGATFIDRCWDIQVANETNLYLLANGLVTHNSYLLATIALEHAIQHPGSDIKIATPNQKMTRKIMIPLMKQIMTDCPKHLRPKLKTQDGVLEFTNGSTITIAGTEQGQIDSLRGTACDLIIIDEAGFVSDLEYALESVLMPQTLTRPNARVILASTPPVSPDHKFVQYAYKAMNDGAYAKYTIYDNPLLTLEQIEEFMQESGGETSTTWRREYLAEFVTDTSMALFPEASEDLVAEITLAAARPEFFLPITAIDLGYVDHTGILFGYYHFLLGKVIIEDEVLVNRTTSAKIAEIVLAKELELWGHNNPHIRVVDGNAMAIADLNETHGLYCYRPDKTDLEAGVNKVRIDLMNRNLMVHPRCQLLQAQLKYATWDKTKTKFSRSSEGGHWDLVASLVYLLKHIDRSTNPYPANYGYDPFKTFGYPRRHQTAGEATVRTMFPLLFRR